MTIKEFENKYKDKGGLLKLTELTSLLCTQEYIAKQFGVSKESIRLWIPEIFGYNYDPRKGRETAIKIGMLNFGRKNAKKEFTLAFKGSPYYKEVKNLLEKK